MIYHRKQVTMKKVILIILVLTISCKENNSQKEIFKNAELIVERGAFHFDRFVLNNNEITFLEFEDNTNDYKLVDKKKIDKQLIQDFFNKIIKEGIFQLNTNYKCSNSCSSSLRVRFVNGNNKIDISCQDWQKNCPKLLKFIELEIVKLQGEKRFRSKLPG